MRPVLAAVVKNTRSAVCYGKNAERYSSEPKMRFIPVYTEIDQLSNSVNDLIKENKLDEAEAVSRRLLAEYPDRLMASTA